MIPRITISEAAQELVQRLQAQYGELMFHQSGGCCDGSAPMCFAKGEFRVGSNDVKLGTVENCEFWMSSDQFEYWKHTQLKLDVTPGRGSSFSLEIPLGVRFIIESRMYKEEEIPLLEEVTKGE